MSYEKLRYPEMQKVTEVGKAGEGMEFKLPQDSPSFSSYLYVRPLNLVEEFTDSYSRSRWQALFDIVVRYPGYWTNPRCGLARNEKSCGDIVYWRYNRTPTTSITVSKAWSTRLKATGRCNIDLVRK